MKSLSITVLVTIVLLAAGLIVVYKTPAPDIAADSYVLRVSPSEPAGSQHVESALDRQELADAVTRDAVPDRSARGDAGPKKIDDRLVTQTEPPRYRPRFGVSREDAPRFESKTAEQPPPLPSSPSEQAWQERDAKTEVAAAPEPTLHPPTGIASTADLIAKLARETDEADRLARAEAGEKDLPLAPFTPADVGDADKAASPLATEGRFSAPARQAAPDIVTVPERQASPQPFEKPADASSAHTEKKEAPPAQGLAWQTVTVTRAEEPKPSASINSRPGAEARQPTPPAPLPRAGASPQIPRARTAAAATESRPPTALTAGAEERNAAETKTAVLGVSRLAAPETGSALVSIIIRDLGLDERDTYNAITNLGPNVTLAFSPYGRDAKGWAMKARQDGHEVFLGIPMEPTASLGAEMPNMLLASLPREENLKRLDWLIAQIGEFNGFINIMGGRLSQTPEAMRAVMEALKARDLPYLDDGEAAHPIALLTAAELKMRYRVADESAKDLRAINDIAGLLARLETTARQKGSAIAILPPDTETIRQVILWSSNLQQKGIKLVPASQIIGVATLP